MLSMVISKRNLKQQTRVKKFKWHSNFGKLRCCYTLLSLWPCVGVSGQRAVAMEAPPQTFKHLKSSYLFTSSLKLL